jgi:hypothetical protein
VESLNYGRITPQAVVKYVLIAAKSIFSLQATSTSVITMTTKPIKSKSKTKKRRHAGRAADRVERVQLGCPNHNCAGVCLYVFVGDEMGLQCGICGSVFKMDNGLSRPWLI